MSGARGNGEPLPELPYLVSPALRQRLDLVHHLLEFGNRLVILQGPRGAGRSRMLDTVCVEADAGWTVVQPRAEDLDSPARLRELLAHELALTADEAARTPEPDSEIARALARLESDRRLCLIALDDADDLPDTVLEALFRLAHTPEGSGRLRVVLVATAGLGLVQRIEATTPEPALVHVVAVPELTDAQAAELRALMEGDESEPAEDPDPAGVNPARLLESLRRAAPPDESAPESRSAVRPRYFAGPLMLGALVVAGVLVALWRAGDPEPVREPLVVTLPGAPVEPLSPVAGEAPTAGGTDPPTRPDATGGVAQERPEAASAAPVPGAPPGTADGAAGDAAEESAVPETLPAPAGTAGALEPGAATGGAAPGAAGDAARNPTAATAPETTRDGAEIPAGEAVRSAGPEGATDSPAEPEARTSAPRPPAPASGADPPRSAPSARAKTPERVALEGLYSEKWVLTRDPDTYVIQLFGVRDRSAAVRFLRDTPAARPGAIVERTHEGAPWYIVVHGHYPDRDHARAAIEALPPRLSALRPWARPVHSLRP